MAQTARGKREFVMLAETLTPKVRNEYNLGHWWLSEKLDGMRALWLPDTMGMRFGDVLFGNLTSEKRGPKNIANRPVTGLWSRYGRPIWAPQSWINGLLSSGILRMDRAFDGELFIGNGQRQELMSICKTVSGATDGDWHKIKYCIFDSPRWSEVYSDGKIHNGVFKKNLVGVYEHMVATNALYRDCYREDRGRNETFEYLVAKGFVKLPFQQQLHWRPAEAHQQIEQVMEEILAAGGEGLIVRHGGAVWTPLRVNTMFKYKPYLDSEAVVVGYEDGKGRLEGTIGSVQLRWTNGSRVVEFGLSGWTDDERDLIRDGLLCKVNDVVTFRYRELSVDGVPIEARYLRDKVDE